MTYHTWKLREKGRKVGPRGNFLLIVCPFFIKAKEIYRSSTGSKKSMVVLLLAKNIKTVSKWMSLYKWPLYDLFRPFFAMCMFFFHKTEVLTVILRCLTGLTYDWFKSYDTKRKYFYFFFFLQFCSKTDDFVFCIFCVFVFFVITFVPIKI